MRQEGTKAAAPGQGICFTLPCESPHVRLSQYVAPAPPRAAKNEQRFTSRIAADTLTRLHALTKADNLGLGLVVLGLLPQAGSLRIAFKLVCIWLLVLLAGATVSQLIARAARQAEPPP